MADLSTNNSGYSTGSLDTWTSAVNNVTPHRAEHVNGLASAILQIEAMLGSGPTLSGSLASLAARLAVQIPSDGVILPPGTGAPYFGSSAPTGWLFCDGSAVSRTTYAALFTALGGASSPYGLGDLSTTFNLPDLRGRAPVGAGTGAGGGTSGTGVVTGGSALTARATGAWFGAETHTLTEAQLPAHAHAQNVLEPTGALTTADFSSTGNGAGVNGANVNTANTGGGQAHNNVQPSLACNWIVKI